jgi:hypothetical protein
MPFSRADPALTALVPLVFSRCSDYPALGYSRSRARLRLHHRRRHTRRTRHLCVRLASATRPDRHPAHV